MSAALLPCPFCGGPPRYLAGKSGFYSERVICDTCDFWMTPAAWNKRPAIAPPVAAGSVDTAEFREVLNAAVMCISSMQIQCNARLLDHIDAWGAQQREAGRQSEAAHILRLTHERDLALASTRAYAERAEKVEATVRRLEYYLRQMGMDIPEPFGQPIDPSDTPTV